MARRTSFTTRLFVAFFLLSAAPAAALLGLATWGLRDYVRLTGDAGAWSDVTDSGRDLLSAVEASGPDSALTAAADAHARALSRSVGLARRFDLVASRLAAALPWAALAIGLFLAVFAFLAARSLARGLSRPVAELVEWSDRLAREVGLPTPAPDEDQGAAEFGVLRHAFREMADRLAEGRRKALEAERLRTWSEMARRVAHEIKNPLTPLSLAVRQARRAAESGRSTELQEPLAVIESEAARLDEMARGFAQLGRLPDEPVIDVDLPELLRGLTSSDLPESVVREVRVLEAPPHVPGHLAALTRAFRNLLANAAAAVEGRPNPRVEVTIQPADGSVEVAIADNGPGVPAEHRERIWDPDFTTRKRGTGLGLALVRQTISAHGGDVRLTEGDGGARFVVRLPVKAEASPQREASI